MTNYNTGRRDGYDIECMTFFQQYHFGGNTWEVTGSGSFSAHR